METTADLYNKIAVRIIQSQEKIIGPVAWMYIANVPGLTVISEKLGTIEIHGNAHAVIDALIQKCVFLWGRLGLLECKYATEDILRNLSYKDIPERLKAATI